jgi:hypothetical protein
MGVPCASGATNCVDDIGSFSDGLVNDDLDLQLAVGAMGRRSDRFVYFERWAGGAMGVPLASVATDCVDDIGWWRD